MSAEANKALVRRFLAAWNRRDMDAMAREWAPNMVHHTRTGSYGTTQVSSLITGFMQAFPDLEFKIENMVADGDFVATRMAARATHRHEFMGVPPTGRQVTCSVMGLVRVTEGRIVEHWNVMDELHLMHQIGLVPDAYLTAMASS
jgi:C-1 hydroxylase